MTKRFIRCVKERQQASEQLLEAGTFDWYVGSLHICIKLWLPHLTYLIQRDTLQNYISCNHLVIDFSLLGYFSQISIWIEFRWYYDSLSSFLTILCRQIQLTGLCAHMWLAT